jgi:hypothetical protein
MVLLFELADIRLRRLVAEGHALGIPLEIAGAGQDHDAFNETPQRRESEGESTEKEGRGDLENSDRRVSQVETMDAKASKEDSEQTCDQLGLGLRVPVSGVRHGWLLGHVRVRLLVLTLTRVRLLGLPRVRWLGGLITLVVLRVVPRLKLRRGRGPRVGLPRRSLSVRSRRLRCHGRLPLGLTGRGTRRGRRRLFLIRLRHLSPFDGVVRIISP